MRPPKHIETVSMFRFELSCILTSGPMGWYVARTCCMAFLHAQSEPSVTDAVSDETIPERWLCTARAHTHTHTSTSLGLVAQGGMGTFEEAISLRSQQHLGSLAMCRCLGPNRATSCEKTNSGKQLEEHICKAGRPKVLKSWTPSNKAKQSNSTSAKGSGAVFNADCSCPTYHHMISRLLRIERLALFCWPDLGYLPDNGCHLLTSSSLYLSVNGHITVTSTHDFQPNALTIQTNRHIAFGNLGPEQDLRIRKSWSLDTINAKELNERNRWSLTPEQHTSHEEISESTTSWYRNRSISCLVLQNHMGGSPQQELYSGSASHCRGWFMHSDWDFGPLWHHNHISLSLSLALSLSRSLALSLVLSLSLSFSLMLWSYYLGQVWPSQGLLSGPSRDCYMSKAHS